jgi:RNase P/RNase MRP subunit p29
VGTANLYLRA